MSGEAGTVAVVGGGWAGLAAAVEATRAGARVTLFEMAPRLGGRARDLPGRDPALDNGQHICIGAYVETLRLLADLGVAESDAFVRLPLQLLDANGHGLALGDGPTALAFGIAVLRHRVWRLRDKLSLLRAAAAWAASRFECDPRLTVSELTAALTPAVRTGVIEPLCVAALNTEADAASASTFLRVLHDALLSGPGSADLLLPRLGLGRLLPSPAAAWLERHGGSVRLRRRVESMAVDADGCVVDGERFDSAVLATSAHEAARLTRPFAPTWSAVAAALRHSPIVTVYLRSGGSTMPRPMLMLRDDAERPAQFVFDRGRLGGPAGLLAFVISGADRWIGLDRATVVAAVVAQAEAELGRWLDGPLEPVQVVVEKRATFRCTPSLQRPPSRIADAVFVAGDYVDGSYPATLEGAVRSGLAAARALCAGAGRGESPSRFVRMP